MLKFPFSPNSKLNRLKSKGDAHNIFVAPATSEKLEVADVSKSFCGRYAALNCFAFDVKNELRFRFR